MAHIYIYTCVILFVSLYRLLPPDICLSLLCVQHCATYWLSKCIDLLIYLYRNRIAFSCSPFHPSFVYIFAFYICNLIFLFSSFRAPIWDLWVFVCVKVRILRVVSLFVKSSTDLGLNALELCRCVAYEIAAGIVITIFLNYWPTRWAKDH